MISKTKLVDTAFETFKVAWLLSSGVIIGWKISNEKAIQMAQENIIIGTPTPSVPEILWVIMLSGFIYVFLVFVSDILESVKSVVAKCR